MAHKNPTNPALVAALKPIGITITTSGNNYTATTGPIRETDAASALWAARFMISTLRGLADRIEAATAPAEDEELEAARTAHARYMAAP